ncbi:MAG TPA: hypothetical protein VGO58_13505 [Chitinophagaceae bacterium]|jgi:hypothetical protein|nr:hypothetical protein [Chitinophagaceae bacterium]
MKKLKLLLPFLLLSMLAQSQAGQINQVNIVNFTVKNVLPGTIDSWLSIPGALMLTAQKVPGSQIKEPAMVVQIRSGSSIICGNTTATPKRVDPFDVRVFNTADLTGILNNCRELKAGTYSICVQFYNIDKVAISREVCKDFRVEETSIEYAPPTLIIPDDKKKFTVNELMQPLQFRWTPLVPKPRDPVTYKLRVWQLMQGQNGAAAMRSNTPVVEREVKEITQATVTGLLTGPCKPPYLCDFIWNVQALNREGKPMGKNNGMSEPWSFGAASTNEITPPKNMLPENSKQFNGDDAKHEIRFQWTGITPKPTEPVTYKLRVWQLMQGQNGTTAMRSNKPIVEKDVTNITETTANGIYTGPCKPPYLCDFIWNVQVVTRDGTPGTASEPTVFNVSEKNNGIVNTFPEDKKGFTLDEAKGEMKFRWTALVPKPREPVTYRLRVWQLMQGQNGTAAMKTNNPVVTKDVTDITEAAVSGILTGPCKPPYLCDFIWAVQVVTRDGTTGVTSDPTTFNVSENNNGIVNTFPDDKKNFPPEELKGEVKFRWTALVPKPREPVTYRLRVWQLMQGQNGTQAMKTNGPLITKDVKDITEATVSGILTGPCKPPYLCDFVWNVQALDREGNPVGSNNGTTKEWSFGATSPALVTPPGNVLPEKDKQLDPEEAKQQVKFQWTAVSPKQTEPVTYKLRVWQLMQGQNGTTAMKNNKPIVEKDVVNTTEATVSGIYTGPCKPPYLCDFIWNVQAVTREGKPLGSNNGTSEPTMFFVSTYIIKLDSIKVLCTSKPGVYSFSYTISNVNPGTANLTNFAITSSVPAGATVGSFAPPLGTSIGSGNQLTITGTINAATNLSNICLGAEITDAVNSFWKASKDTCVPVLPCKCDVCDSVKIEVNPKDEIKQDTAGNIIQNSTITVTPKPVKSIKAELIYYEYKPKSDDCMICNKDSKTYGNFINAATGISSAALIAGHSVFWPINGQMVNNTQMNFTISMPPTVKCCDAEVKWCIRYVVTFMDCTVCNKLVCYSYNKKCDCK